MFLGIQIYSTLFLAAPSSSRSLVGRWLVGWSQGVCEKVTIRVSNKRYLKPSYLSTCVMVVTVVAVVTAMTAETVVTEVAVVTLVTKKLFHTTNV